MYFKSFFLGGGLTAQKVDGQEINWGFQEYNFSSLDVVQWCAFGVVVRAVADWKTSPIWLAGWLALTAIEKKPDQMRFCDP